MARLVRMASIAALLVGVGALGVTAQDTAQVKPKPSGFAGLLKRARDLAHAIDSATKARSQAKTPADSARGPDSTGSAVIPPPPTVDAPPLPPVTPDTTSRTAPAPQQTGDTLRSRYGYVPMRTYGSVSMSADRSAQRPTADSTPRPTPPPAASANVGIRWTGRYYYQDERGILHNWDFAADGTYLYREVYSAGTMTRSSSERGAYTLDGGMLAVRVTRTTDAANTTAGGRTTMMSGETGSGQTRHYAFQLVGPSGRDGIVMDGITLKPRSW
jgi:hypothetical protein